MRKGFDRQLAEALQTTPRTLFVDYANVAPEKAAMVGRLLRDPGVPITVTGTEIFPTDPLLREITARLDPVEKQQVCTYAITLVLAQQDGRTAEFQRYGRQLKGHEDMPDAPEDHPAAEPPPRKRKAGPPANGGGTPSDRRHGGDQGGRRNPT